MRKFRIVCGLLAVGISVLLCSGRSFARENANVPDGKTTFHGVSFADYEKYFHDSLVFDFCGLEPPGGESSARMIRADVIKRRWLRDALFHAELTRATRICGDYERAVWEHASDVVADKRGELAVLCGELSRRMRERAGGRWCFAQVVSRIEYMFARLLTLRRGETTLDGKTILEVLPDALWESVRVGGRIHSFEFGDVKRCLAFRNLLIIGCALERARHELGLCPESLSQVPEVGRFVRFFSRSPVLYRRQSDAWELFCPTFANEKTASAFNCFAPAILDGEVRSETKTTGISLSSDYAERRRAIFLGSVDCRPCGGYLLKDDGRIDVCPSNHL